MSFKINVQEDEQNPMLELTFDDGSFMRFSVRNVAEESRKWLGDVLEGEVNRIIRQVKLNERQRIQNGIKGLLGITEPEKQ